MPRLRMMPRPNLDRVAKTHRPSSYRVTKPKKPASNIKTLSKRPAKPKRKQPAPPQPESTQSSIPRDVHCDCIYGHPPPEGEDDKDLDFFVCVTCLSLQHPACATSNTNMHTQLRCNPCDLSDLTTQIRIYQEALEEMKVLVGEMKEEARKFYAETLWKHYCNLPNGRASEGVIAITQTESRYGASVPVFPAPEAWVTEVHGRFMKMINDAGEDKAKEILGPSSAVADLGWKDLRNWSDLAMWLLYRGPYRGRKGELGIIAEIVGLVDKGTFWNGIGMRVSWTERDVNDKETGSASKDGEVQREMGQDSK